jgi:hypothetical protein
MLFLAKDRQRCGKIQHGRRGASLLWIITMTQNVILKLSLLITLQWPLNIQVEGRVVHLPLSQKLEMNKLSEEDMSKAKAGWELEMWYQTVRQIMNVQEKILKEIKSTTSGNKW